jgi:hypothetical protein
MEGDDCYVGWHDEDSGNGMHVLFLLLLEGGFVAAPGHYGMGPKKLFRGQCCWNPGLLEHDVWGC